jgi:hypothetical protein
MGNLLNGIYYYFSFNGFFYLLNYIDPPTTPLSHSCPSPAHPPTLVLDLQSIWSFVDYFVSSFFEVSRVHPVLKVPV